MWLVSCFVFLRFCDSWFWASSESRVTIWACLHLGLSSTSERLPTLLALMPRVMCVG